jgi:hypothetical protein
LFENKLGIDSTFGQMQLQVGQSSVFFFFEISMLFCSDMIVGITVSGSSVIQKKAK